MTIAELHQLFLQHPKACTDTRKIEVDCIFFALKGDNFNGNAYAAEALNKGAAFAIVDEPKFVTSKNTILVNDVLTTLQELATYHRSKSKATVVALTGSNGKTTTKELINAVLSKKFRTIATLGNLNNHIGVPLTLLSIEPDTEMAIVEMGANHAKEIAQLCTFAQPDFGYITNFGKAHLEGFGSVQGVIRAKSELYDHLIAHKKGIFLNADDPIQLEKIGSYIEKYGFSKEKETYYPISFIGADPFVHIAFEDQVAQTQLIGSYNFNNCCAAILIGKYFNVPLNKITEALEAYVPDNNRSQIIEKNGRKIILDAYNANPTSMTLALQNLEQLSDKPKFAILGDMFELGEQSSDEHQGIAEMVERFNFDKAFLIGTHFFDTKTKLDKFKTFEAVENYLKAMPIPEDGTILIKGSRGMALERLLPLL